MLRGVWAANVQTRISCSVDGFFDHSVQSLTFAVPVVWLGVATAQGAFGRHDGTDRR